MVLMPVVGFAPPVGRRRQRHDQIVEVRVSFVEMRGWACEPALPNARVKGCDGVPQTRCDALKSNNNQFKVEPNFQQLSRTTAWTSLQPRLKGAEADILYVIRPNARRGNGADSNSRSSAVLGTVDFRVRWALECHRANLGQTNDQ
jgi:hypothetical protein